MDQAVTGDVQNRYCRGTLSATCDAARRWSCAVAPIAGSARDDDRRASSAYPAMHGLGGKCVARVSYPGVPVIFSPNVAVGKMA